jgi:hypothetical protein
LRTSTSIWATTLTLLALTLLINQSDLKQRRIPIKVPIITADDIDLVGIAFALPSSNVNQPLFTGLDADKIAQLAQWYDEARAISDTSLSAPHRGWHLQFVRKNGTFVDITPASHATEVPIKPDPFQSPVQRWKTG